MLVDCGMLQWENGLTKQGLTTKNYPKKSINKM